MNLLIIPTKRALSVRFRTVGLQTPNGRGD